MKIGYTLVLIICLSLCFTIKIIKYHSIISKLDSLKYDDNILKQEIDKHIVKNTTEILVNFNKTEEITSILLKKCGNKLSNCYFNTIEDEELVEKTNKELIQSVVSLQNQLDELRNQINNKT